MVLGSGFWVTIKARRVAPSAARPHGIDYGLCLLGPDDERLICYDNAHPVAVGSEPAKQPSDENDHVHKGERVIPYRYTDAETLLVDFWDDVDRLMREMAP